MNKLLVAVSRVFVGVVFIFSGLIKLNDPVGTAIKLEEYFEVFSYDFASFFHTFIPMALPLAVFLNVLEVVLGIALLINYRTQITSLLLLAIIVFFTFLTFYSAYFNKVTDCGCFGDAIKLTPWQSFTKDIILLFFILIIFIYRKQQKEMLPPVAGHIVTGAVTLASLMAAIYCIRHLPVIDFRAYKIGVNLPTAMKDSAPIRYAYIMEKDGKKERFEQYPSDPAYTFVEMIMLNPEDKAKITDYSVWNDEGDFTQSTFEGKKLVIVSVFTDKASVEGFKKMNALAIKAEQAGIEPMILTSSDYTRIEEFRHEHQLAMPYYYADATVLKTMIRSNPGLILMQDGTILGKWHHNDTPELADLQQLIK